MPRRIEDYRGLAELSRLKLLYAVQRRPGRRLPELAEEAGVHVNTARDHLRILEDEGLVSSRPVATGSRGRPPSEFHPVRQIAANAEAARRVSRATAQGDLLRRISPEYGSDETLGEDALHQLDTLYAHLEDVGFAPEIDEETLTVELKPCPFHRIMKDNLQVVCAVHANLVKEQLAQVPGPLVLDRLEPLVTPHQCRVALAAGESANSVPPGTPQHAGNDQRKSPDENQ